jgi:hypothetical protein
LAIATGGLKMVRQAKRKLASECKSHLYKG